MRGMPRPLFLLLLLLRVSTPPPAAGEPAPKEPVTSAEGARAAVEEIAHRVAAIRGLEFKKPVPVEVVGREAILEYATRRVARFSSPEEVASEDRAFAVLGLVPPGTSTLDAYTGAVEDSVAGYYDPERKEFYLMDDLPLEVGSIFAAHELTHALEDQYYDLDARIEKSKDDGDAAFAVMAVHEGSASLLMAIYVREALEKGFMKREDLETLASTQAARGDKLAALDPVLRRPLLGAYVLGARFLARDGASLSGGAGYPLADAERCYRDGPVSSEQILHPEKYWDPLRRDLPRPVVLPDVAPLLGAAWTLAGRGILGELLLGPLVGAPTPGSWTAESIRGDGWTNRAASGWGGDRWELWTSGDRAMVLLSTVWDTAKDAREFERALPSRAALSSKRTGERVALVAGATDDGTARRLLRAMLGAR